MVNLDAQANWFKSSDGSNRFYRKTAHVNERLRVVVSHGLGEHSGRYGHVIDTLGPMGATLWILDHQGHGRSHGKRGHVNGFGDYVADLKALVELARTENKDQLPVLLLGHSMGGLIALLFAGRYPQYIEGLILSSPLLGLPKPPPPVLRVVAGMLSAIWPTFSLDNQLDPAMISHDPNEIKAYTQDKRVHNRISARWYTECMAAISAVNGAPEKIQSPILMQVAGADRLVSAPSALAFFDTLTVTDKTLCHYESLYHEIFNETPENREKVLEELRQWVAARYL